MVVARQDRSEKLPAKTVTAMEAEKETMKKRRVGDGTPGPGRPKGVPNKLTSDVKAMILAALDKAGGAEYLLA